jgi:hypothetical protein
MKRAVHSIPPAAPSRKQRGYIHFQPSLIITMATAMISAAAELGPPRFLSKNSSFSGDERQFPQQAKSNTNRFSDSENLDPNTDSIRSGNTTSSEALEILTCETSSRSEKQQKNKEFLQPTSPSETEVETEKEEEKQDDFYTDDYSISTVDSTDRLNSSAIDEVNAPPLPVPEAFGSSHYPRKSILKASTEETIPICTKPRSWRKLPAPNMEQIKRKRQASLGSYQDATPSSSSVRRVQSEGSRVNFQSVLIREYQQTIGDNPSVSYGTPISLDWDYQQHSPLPLDMYEASKVSKRSLRQLFMNHYQRKNLLVHKYGHSEDEVKAAKYQTNKVRSQREMSRMMQLTFGPLIWLEEMRESAVRKVKRRMNKE